LLEDGVKNVKDKDEATRRAQFSLGTNNPGAWKLEFQDLIQSALLIASNTPEPILKNGLALLKLLGDFKRFCLVSTIEIIEELIFPVSSRKHKPTMVVPSVGTQDPNIPSRLLYSFEHILIYLSIPEEVIRYHLKDSGFDPLVIEESSVHYSSRRKRSQSLSSSDKIH
jgi:hypothetical protein